jgi:hypothetical protein
MLNVLGLRFFLVGLEKYINIYIYPTKKKKKKKKKKKNLKKKKKNLKITKITKKKN